MSHTRRERSYLYRTPRRPVSASRARSHPISSQCYDRASKISFCQKGEKVDQRRPTHTRVIPLRGKFQTGGKNREPDNIINSEKIFRTSLTTFRGRGSFLGVGCDRRRERARENARSGRLPDSSVVHRVSFVLHSARSALRGVPHGNRRRRVHTALRSLRDRGRGAAPLGAFPVIDTAQEGQTSRSRELGLWGD